MPEVRVRNLDAWIVEVLKSRAKRHKRSLEAELRHILREEVIGEKKALADRARDRLAKLRTKYGIFSDSAPLIREDRDTRG